MKTLKEIFNKLKELIIINKKYYFSDLWGYNINFFYWEQEDFDNYKYDNKKFNENLNNYLNDKSKFIKNYKSILKSNER